MDPRERAVLEAAIARGEAFSALQSHLTWPAFREWLEQLRDDYERLVHASQNRSDHIALVRALEGHDVVKNLLDNFERAITKLPELRDKLDAANKPAA